MSIVVRGCGVRRESPTMSAHPMPAFAAQVDRQEVTDEDAMRSDAGLLKWFPEIGWVSVYLCSAGYYAYIDRRGKYTSRPVQSLEQLPIEALCGPLTWQPCPNTSASRSKQWKKKKKEYKV